MCVEHTRYESRLEADMPPRVTRNLRSRKLALLCVSIAITTGCDGSDFVRRQTEGDRVIFTNPAAWGLTITLAVLLLGIGVLLVAGRLRFKGKPRVLGAVLAAFGFGFAFYAVVIAPYTYMAIDHRELIVQSGWFGQSQTTVDLTQTETIEVYCVGRSRPRKRGTSSRRTYVRFTPHQGEPQVINMGGDIGAATLQRLKEVASDLEIAVTDRRQ